MSELPIIARGTKPDRPASGQLLPCVDETGKRLIIVFCGCGATYRSTPNKTGDAPKMPKGWRSIDGEYCCGDCVAKRYYVRSFRVQIVGLAEEKDPADGGRTYEEFRKDLAAAAKESARYANWLLQQLFAADPAASTEQTGWKTSAAGKPQMPPLPKVDGYRPDLFPQISGAGMSGLSQIVTRFYSEHRWDAFVALNRSVQNYRFGYLPVEVRAADWQIATDADGKFVFRRLSVRPGKSWNVRVWAEGINLQRLRACADGSAVPLACKIVRRSKTLRDGQMVKTWFIRAAGMFPRSTVRRQSHREITLTLGHDHGSLLYGVVEGVEEPFEFPGVEVRKLIVGGDIADRRRQQEQSFTRGLMPRRKHKRWSRDRTNICDNRTRKIDYQVRLAAAALARWCRSHGVTSVDYDHTDRGFVAHFPYRRLRDYIAMKLEQDGIALHVVGAEETNQEQASALAGPGTGNG